MLVYDATVEPAHEVNLGPGSTLAHAFLPGSRVALCGVLRSENPPIRSGRKCGECLAYAGSRSWVTR